MRACHFAGAFWSSTLVFRSKWPASSRRAETSKGQTKDNRGFRQDQGQRNEAFGRLELKKISLDTKETASFWGTPRPSTPRACSIACVSKQKVRHRPSRQPCGIDRSPLTMPDSWRWMTRTTRTTRTATMVPNGDIMWNINVDELVSSKSSDSKHP